MSWPLPDPVAGYPFHSPAVHTQPQQYSHLAHPRPPQQPVVLPHPHAHLHRTHPHQHLHPMVATSYPFAAPPHTHQSTTPMAVYPTLQPPQPQQTQPLEPHGPAVRLSQPAQAQAAPVQPAATAQSTLPVAKPAAPQTKAEKKVAAAAAAAPQSNRITAQKPAAAKPEAQQKKADKKAAAAAKTAASKPAAHAATAAPPQQQQQKAAAKPTKPEGSDAAQKPAVSPPRPQPEQQTEKSDSAADADTKPAAEAAPEGAAAAAAETPAEGEAGEVAEGEDGAAQGVKQRYRAVIMRIGDEPLLSIDSVGEFRFAYRNVKKKPGESRPFLQVGDEVECRLTKSAPPKAVSLRVTKQIQQQPAFSHDPYSTTEVVKAQPAAELLQSSSLYSAMGGTAGINQFVDTCVTTAAPDAPSKAVGGCAVVSAAALHEAASHACAAAPVPAAGAPRKETAKKVAAAWPPRRVRSSSCPPNNGYSHDLALC